MWLLEYELSIQFFNSVQLCVLITIFYFLIIRYIKYLINNSQEYI